MHDGETCWPVQILLQSRGGCAATTPALVRGRVIISRKLLCVICARCFSTIRSANRAAFTFPAERYERETDGQRDDDSAAWYLF
jgi:hypothetical protein